MKDTNKNSYDSLVWREKNGTSTKLIDASMSDLKKWYNHCYEMLNNKNVWNPGKLTIKSNINKIWDACNAELFSRYLLSENLYDFNDEDYFKLNTKKEILDYITSVSSGYVIESLSVNNIFKDIPPIFKTVLIKDLINSCVDKLEIINKKIIPSTFIISQGIWLTKEEKLDLFEEDTNGLARNRLDVIKERLGIYDNVQLRVRSKGLNYSEFRAMIQMPDLAKISTLPSITLITLRDKILYLLEVNLNYHIDKWTKLLESISSVIEYQDSGWKELSDNGKE